MSITWPDGRVFIVESVGAVRRRSACVEGGPGIKYDITVAGKDTHIIERDRRWYMEIDDR